MVPGGGIEPPSAEARRILSLRPSFCDPQQLNGFYTLRLDVIRGPYRFV